MSTLTLTLQYGKPVPRRHSSRLSAPVAVQEKDVEVTPIPKTKGWTLDELHELDIRSQVHTFSEFVLGLKYQDLKRLLYPSPVYRSFDIVKRSGSLRTICEPNKKVKDLQQKLLSYIKKHATPTKQCVHGFVDGRSIVSNARQHLKRTPHHVLNLDLENFFPSISFYRVRGVFQNAPFNCSHEVATVIAQLATFQGTLPQGAPTSPFVSNLVCRSLDGELTALAKRNRSTYTRYADDLTFSFSVRNPSNLPANICSFDSGELTLGRELISIIEGKNNFAINRNKTRISSRNNRMEVTGIAINDFPNVRRNFVDRIRGGLHAWRRYGYVATQSEWEARVANAKSAKSGRGPWSRQTRTDAIPELKRVLWGKLLYVRMVRGSDDTLYTRLAECFNDLVRQERSADPDFECPLLPVRFVVRNQVDAERAVFVIEWSGDYLHTPGAPTESAHSQGTAFAYRAADQLITCDHVFRSTITVNGSKLGVDYQDGAFTSRSLTICNPVTKISISAEIVARDSARDLAVLRVIEPSLQLYFSGVERAIDRRQPGVLIGFPNWTPGRSSNQIGSSVVNRFPRSGLQRFEISASVRSGNSGGPFVDNSYRVGGVAQQGASQRSGNDECLCVLELDSWLRGLSQSA